MLLHVTVLVAVPSVPVLVDQVKERALPCASLARTRKTTVLPAAGTEAMDWKASTTSGGKRPVEGAPTKMTLSRLSQPRAGEVTPDSS
ncbi:hypothetical protein F0U60_19285 [Archangium minus]|uniref:Secreted protein n=1 Tax=Archangium minus TaxID=83450 RepID=A0ABY9WT83_9BACT|nr:hypothetical protein F0U60_19285 [Archangium minus]